MEFPPLTLFTYEYKIEAKKTGFASFTFKITGKNGKFREFSISPLTESFFIEAVKKEFKNLDSTAYKEIFTNDTTKIKKASLEIRKIYFSLVAVDVTLNTLNNSPVAVQLSFEDSALVHQSYQKYKRLARIARYYLSHKKSSSINRIKKIEEGLDTAFFKHIITGWSYPKILNSDNEINILGLLHLNVYKRSYMYGSRVYNRKGFNTVLTSQIIHQLYLSKRREYVEKLKNYEQSHAEYSDIDKQIKSQDSLLQILNDSLSQNPLKTSTDSLKWNVTNDSIGQSETMIHGLKLKRLLADIGLDSSRVVMDSVRQQVPMERLNIQEVELEINNGFIEKIQVFGKLKILNENESFGSINPNQYGIINKQIKFENYFPIGFSRQEDFRKLNKYHLKGIIRINDRKIKYSLNLSSLISKLNEEFAVDRRDYSPKNQTLLINMKRDNIANIKLLKETTFKLFEANIFSDFIGFDEDQPNGLIQTEVKKPLSLNTSKFCRMRRLNFGLLEYVEPFLVVSKVENTNKNLSVSVLDQFIDGEYVPVKYAATLDIKRKESFRTGIDINILATDLPTLKSKIYANIDLAYGITPAEDSIKFFRDNRIEVSDALNEFKINTSSFCPNIKWEVRTDERYGFDFVFKHHVFSARTNLFNQVANSAAFKTSRTRGKRRIQFNNLVLMGYFKPSEVSDGKIFFRYQYNWQQDYWNTGFNQAQVGYSFYILKKQG